MRSVQYRILKNILEKIEVPNYVHAFETGRSIPSMAQLHTNKRVIISLDLKDFFTSIKEYHLNQLFQHLGFSSLPAKTLSELCTYKSFVPQGALTSPKVSNLITMFTFGPLVKSYCDSKGYTLSIYADDITISSNTKLDGLEGRDTIPNLIKFIKETLSKFNFKLNKEKIKVMNNYQRQYVCGAVVNEKVNMQKSERNKLRAIVYNCNKNGIEHEALKNEQTSSEFSSKIMGRINWYSQLNPESGTLLKDIFKQVCADQIMCPTAVTESVKEIGPLDSQSDQVITEYINDTSAPWI